ncbi:MAG TPA: Crp/Fnr family transcriptional regulator [Sediminibacterium sp.]|nr:Crp/Fnr family transcriptional regulator [Sediminibacterium sp.]
MSELEKYIQSFFGVSQEDLFKITSLFKPASLSKNGYFLKAGYYCNKLGFLQSGMIREYLIVGDKEITKWISTSGYFVVDLSSFIFQQKARWNIQALTDCELHVIDAADYRKIHSLVPKWAELEKLFLVKCFTTLEDRVLQHLSLSAEDRYRELLKNSHALFNQVPLQYLASMLGMTPETFSRIRNRLANE